MKISKASWMILGAGIFIIILAGLGLTRSGQIKAYDDLSDNLSATIARLNNLQVGQLQTEINEYTEQLRDAADQTSEAKEKLKQTVISVDVADKFYDIASYCGVIIRSLVTTTIVEQPYSSINCETTSLSGLITGTPEDIVRFVIAVNDNYTTGFIRAAQLQFEDDGCSVNLQMSVYTTKGSQ
jgi:outer membrane murein-binding lipoprotein Lpp